MMKNYLKSGLIDEPNPSLSRCDECWNIILSLWPYELLLIFDPALPPLKLGINESLPINMLLGCEDGLKFRGILTGLVFDPCNSPAVIERKNNYF